MSVFSTLANAVLAGKATFEVTAMTNPCAYGTGTVDVQVSTGNTVAKITFSSEYGAKCWLGGQIANCAGDFADWLDAQDLDPDEMSQEDLEREEQAFTAMRFELASDYISNLDSEEIIAALAIALGKGFRAADVQGKFVATNAVDEDDEYWLVCRLVYATNSLNSKGWQLWFVNNYGERELHDCYDDYAAAKAAFIKHTTAVAA